MENPLHILETGSLATGRGCKSNVRNGVLQRKANSQYSSSTKITFTGNDNAEILSETGLPILCSTGTVAQDGVRFDNEASTTLPGDKATLVLPDYILGGCENSDDVDAQKVDEWLKGKSENSNPVIYEYDFEMKATQEDMFPGDRSLLEDVHLGLTDKDQIVSVAELLGTDLNSKKQSSKISEKLSKKETSSHTLNQTKTVVLPQPVSSESLKSVETAFLTLASPYVLDPSQLDLVEANGQIELEQTDENVAAYPIELCHVGDQENSVPQIQEENLTTVSIQPESDGFVLISVKSQNSEQIFRVKSASALDPTQALTLENLISQPLFLSQDGSCTLTAGSEVVQTEMTIPSELQQQEVENVPESVEVDPWLPSVMAQVGSGRKVMFQCPFEDCDSRFTKETKLRVHILNHERNRPHKCTFMDCDWSFNSEYRLRRHLVSHMGKKNYTCNECAHQFTTKYNLKSHQILHKRPDNVLCPTPGCGKAFSTRRKMEFHLKEHQDMEAPYKCHLPNCGKRFYSANFLSSHLRVHQYSEADLSCPIEGCGRVFIRICQLRQHMRQHTGERPYVCNFVGCGWKFSSASKLTRHMRKHTGERKYVCPEPGCEKSFMRPEHLKGHVIVHSGDRPFFCQVPNCGARFTAKSSLYVHMKRHTGDSAKAVFPCPVAGCTKKYNFKAHLRLHMLKIHASVLVGNSDLDSAAQAALALSDGEEDSEAARLDDIDQEDLEPASSVATAIGSNEGTYVHIPENTSLEDIPQLLLPETLGQTLPSDLLTLTSEDGQLTLTSSQLLVNPVDLLASTEADRAAHSLLADMDQLLMGVDCEVEAVPSPATVDRVAASSPLDPVSGVLGGPAIEVADGGSARTDYSSNLILSSRAKRRRHLQQQFRQQELEASQDAAKDLESLEENGILSAADVVLASSSICLRDTEMATTLLPVSPLPYYMDV